MTNKPRPRQNQQPKQPQVTAVRTEPTLVHTSSSGLIPPSEELSNYDQIIPNGGERIMVLAEKQTDHRIQKEKENLKEYYFTKKLGLLFGFIFAMSALGVAVYCIYRGMEDAVKVIFGSGTAVIVGAFVIGKFGSKDKIDNG